MLHGTVRATFSIGQTSNQFQLEMTPNGFVGSKTNGENDTKALANRNGTAIDAAARVVRPLSGGVHVPTLAFFKPDTEEIDLETTARHAINLAKTGISGLVVHGSNGEAPHLTSDERKA